jgi:hypothetical protein
MVEIDFGATTDALSAGSGETILFRQKAAAKAALIY